ncbi:MAG: DUF4852 domain-containing protein [Alphaproteobacteria bacterium]
MFKQIFVLSALFLSLTFFSSARAEEDEREPRHIIYEVPTVKSLSQLYWALEKFEPEDDQAIDNFLMINECELFREYSQNEFAWDKIRDATRKFTTENRSTFPIRFELLQPLRLAEYDVEKGEFDVWEPYKVDAVQRFELLAEDVFQNICSKPYSHPIAGYPKGLFLELNRPFTLDKIKTSKGVAEQYVFNQVEKNAEKYKKPYEIKKGDYYDSREAYLVMNLRIFAIREELQSHEFILTRALAILEGYSIYGDRERELLLFSENFRRKQGRSKMEVELKKRYQERLKKQMEERKKAAEEKAALEGK